MSLHGGPPVTPIVGICGPRGSCTSEIASWMRESFYCHNPVIHVDDFLKTSSELKKISGNALVRRTSTSAISNVMQGLKELPQAINLPALVTAIKVARQTWANDRFIFVEGVQLLAEEDLVGLLDVKIFLNAGQETCRNAYKGDFGYFDEFVWPLYESLNESYISGTAPNMAVAFHVIDADAPKDEVFESVHRTLTAY